jgi:hypothetical protein
MYAGSTSLTYYGSGETIDGTINWAAFRAADFIAALSQANIPFDAFSEGVVQPVNTTDPLTYSQSLQAALSSNPYVYVYQVVNDRDTPAIFHGMRIFLNSSTATAWGSLPGIGFTYSGSPVGAGNDLPPESVKSQVGIDYVDGLIDPSPEDVTMAPQQNVSSLMISPPLDDQMSSSLLIFTDSAPPVLGSGAVIFDGGISDTGTVVGPGGNNTSVPEPGTLLLLGSGLIGMAAWRPWRKRQ